MKDPFAETIDNFVARRPERKMLEVEIQRKCVDWARSRGWWARKFSSPANRSVPDYLFARDDVKLAIEFKAPGKTSTGAQVEEQKAMRKAGWDVFEISNIEAFKGTLIEAGIRWYNK